MTSGLRLLVALSAGLIACSNWPADAAENDLARAYRVIASKRFVDLTHSFDTRSPVWSGFGQAKMRPAADPKTQRPYTIKDTVSARPFTNSSDSTALMSIRLRISMRTGSPWMRSLSST